MSNTYLTVPFREKDAAKALGARWDGAARRWYVPAGLSLTPFAEWLPAGAGEPAAPALAAAGTDLLANTGANVSPSTSTALQAETRGIPLSRLLQGVARVVADAFTDGVWTTAEVLRASAKNGHVYLELSERDAQGRVLAKANAAIWANTAQRIVPEFERATGTILGAGIKLLIRARPVYKAQFGFSLEIDAIDPTYTLGDLEAKKQEIRDRLTREQLIQLNQRLPSPWDYTTVLVVAPQGGAGLGDFAKEADRLARYGVCQFHYTHCRFQGEGAASEIQDAMNAGLAQFPANQPPDAVILIRGGGAVNDLAWLNDYALARLICECPVPVLTGIGHERDSTVLDEVANLSFDTPSKVIAGIEQTIAQRTRDAQAHFQHIVQRGQNSLERSRATIAHLQRDVTAAAATTLSDARAQSAQSLADIRLHAMAAVHGAKSQVQQHLHAVSHGATTQMAQAKQQVPNLLNQIRTDAFLALRTARWQLHTTLPTVLDRAHLDIGRARTNLTREHQTVLNGARQNLRHAANAAQSLLREITGQGPQKTLSRGFALVRDAHGKTLTRAASAAAAGEVLLVFQDGEARATVHDFTPATPGPNPATRLPENLDP